MPLPTPDARPSLLRIVLRNLRMGECHDLWNVPDVDRLARRRRACRYRERDIGRCANSKCETVGSAGSGRPAVFYESPHRIMKTLESLLKHLGADRRMVIARELTKIFEEVVSGTPSEVLAYFTQNSDKIRGEFVVIVEGGT